MRLMALALTLGLASAGPGPDCAAAALAAILGKARTGPVRGGLPLTLAARL